MPEATAIKPASQTPERKPVNLSPAEQAGGELVENREAIASRNIDKQVKELGLTHAGQIPRSAPHVDAAMQQGIDKRAAEIGRTDLRQPGAYENNKTELSDFAKESGSDLIDFADQVVTGRSHRTTNSKNFSDEKGKMLEFKMRHKTQPAEKSGVIKKMGNWFLEEKKAA